jgi:hypothetical protein
MIDKRPKSVINKNPCLIQKRNGWIRILSQPLRILNDHCLSGRDNEDLFRVNHPTKEVYLNYALCLYRTLIVENLRHCNCS